MADKNKIRIITEIPDLKDQEKSISQQIREAENRARPEADSSKDSRVVPDITDSSDKRSNSSENND